MKTKIKLTIILCFCWFAGFSQVIDANTAYQKAVEFFEFKTNYEKTVSTHTYRVNHISENDTTFIYVVDIDNVGWALVSAVDNAGPYFAYSMSSTIDMNDMPPAAEMWIDYYKNIARHCMHNPQDMRFYQEDFMTKINQKSISQGSFYMIQTRWRQGPPFNDLVEDDGKGVTNDCYSNLKCAAGCLAIAMAQIMRYWVHPFLDYDWCNMPKEIYNSSEDKEIKAISELVRDIGTRVNMRYCIADWLPDTIYSESCQSFALPINAKNAYKDNFEYSNEIEVAYFSNYNNSEWATMLRNELNDSRPVFYTGSNETISTSWHAFVCDGYDYDNPEMFHFNWGWGSTDAFFYLINEHPYSFHQRAIINIKPDSNRTCFFEHTVYENYRHSDDADSLYWTPKAGTIKTAYAPHLVTIMHNEAASYQAFNKIDIKEDFIVEYGADFNALIIQCPLDCIFPPKYINNSKTTYINNYIYDKSESAIELSEKNIEKENTPLNVYPNPVLNKITIESRQHKILKIELYDLFGNRIIIFDTVSHSTVDIGFLEAGIYFLNVQFNNNEQIIKKIIKL